MSAGGKENVSESCETTEVRQSMLEVFSESFFAIGSRTTGGIERRSVASTNIAGSLLALSRASKATIISPRMASETEHSSESLLFLNERPSSSRSFLYYFRTSSLRKHLTRGRNIATEGVLRTHP